ncbi:MAG: transglycosylase SLT domain-containing protein [Deltaproteobacteria bacterium]|nr:transglycosylase SLT domain-containing protein [Deltaproteobacteria bacterium]
MIRNKRFLFLALLFLILPQIAASASHDAAFREGWINLTEEKYAEARNSFRRIPPLVYDLGDYAIYFTGLSFAREGLRGEAASAFDDLSKKFPASPLRPYLAHALAYAAAVDNDLPAARIWFERSQGFASGNGGKAEEGFVAAFLLEADGPSAAAAEAHLENFAAHPAQEAASLSMVRLKSWRASGKWEGWSLPVSFYGKYAKSLSRAVEIEDAKSVYADALRKFPPSDDYYTVLLDYADLLRKAGDTAGSRALLDKAAPGAPPAFRNEARFLRARVDWKAGKLAEARAGFMAIAGEGSVRPGTAERAGYYAAWLAEEEGDGAAANEIYGALREAKDEPIRQEAIFRYAFGHYRGKLYDNAVALFAAGEKTGFSSVERARHAYWRAKALLDSGRKDEAEKSFASIAVDPGAGPYALFAARFSGRDPFAMFKAPSSGETGRCSEEKDQLWKRVRKADWSKADAEHIRRMDRLVHLGITEYAILEACCIDRKAIRNAIGLAEGGTAGLIRYLSGDLRGAIRETTNLPNDPSTVELIDRIQFPLAPDVIGDCDRKRSGMDPLLLHSIVRQESQFQPNALSPAGAIGLMQLMPRTAAEVARKEKMKKPKRKDLLKPKLNVTLGAAYLSRLVREYGGDYFRAVAAYNAGEAAVAKWWRNSGGDPALFLENVTYRETRFYLRRVFFNVLQYYSIYRPRMFARHFPIVPEEGQPTPGAASPPPNEGTIVVPQGRQPIPENGQPAVPPARPPS